LVASDAGSYLYAFELDTGSVFAQPWPCAYGDAWSTSYAGYRKSQFAGHAYAAWDTLKVSPYQQWVETAENNSLNPQTSGNFEFQSGIVRIAGGGDRNMHLLGKSVDTLTNYTLKGMFTFDSSSAEFGVNFYSQWPTQSKKYTFMRETDGHVNLYYYPDSTDAARQLVDTSDIAVADQPGQWYQYEYRLEQPDPDTLKIKAFIWAQDTIKPEIENINKTIIAPPLISGTVGIVDNSGTGYKYFGLLNVVSSDAAPGANMAYETFAADTIVDIKPYTPHNWLPDYRTTAFAVGPDTATGFVLDTSGGTQCLIYRHKDKATYPVTCNLAPYSNIEWKDYEIRGKIIRPAGATYDSIGMGVIFYRQDEKHFYALITKGSVGANSTDMKKLQLRYYSLDSVPSYVDFAEATIDSPLVADSIYMAVRINTEDHWHGSSYIGKVPKFRFKAWLPQNSPPNQWQVTAYDDSNTRQIIGIGGLILTFKRPFQSDQGVKFDKIEIIKVNE
jgi:hypothetical protein